MQDPYGRFADENLIHRNRDPENGNRDPNFADNQHKSSQTSKAPSPTNFEGCIIITANLISVVWGLTCLQFNDLESESLNRLHLFFMISMSTVVVAVLSSILMTLVLFAIGFIIRNPFRSSVFGCCPVLLFLFLYVEYGVILQQGFKLLSENRDTLALSLQAYIIFQLVAGVGFYLMGCYRIFCDRRIISPHLTEIEKETYDIKESEIRDIRNEIQMAKQQRGAELKNMPIVI